MKIPKVRIYTLVLILFSIPLGFYTKFYSGFGYEFVNNKLGGVFYEIFWCLLVSIFLYKVKPVHIVLAVFGFTCLLEFTQLLNFDFLVYIRSNFIGRTIIGNSFSWTDFIYYILGCFLGFFLLTKIKRVSEN